jgi:hypothetical protein
MSRAQRTRGVKDILKGVPKGTMGMKKFKQALREEGLTKQTQKRILGAIQKEQAPQASIGAYPQKPSYAETRGVKKAEPKPELGEKEVEKEIKAGEEVAREVIGRHVEQERRPTTLFGRPITGISGIPSAQAQRIEERFESKESLEKKEHERLRSIERKRRLEQQEEQKKERKTIEDIDKKEREEEQYFADLISQTTKKD